MQKKITSFVKFIIGWPLSVISLIFIIKLVTNETKGGSPIHAVNIPLLLLGVGGFLLYYLFRAIVWHEVLKKKGFDLPFSESTYAWSISEITRYVPGNVWSFLSRAVRFGEKNVPKTDVAHALLIEASLIVLSTVLLSLFGLHFIMSRFFTWIPSFQRWETPIIFISLISTVVYIFQEMLLPRKGSVSAFLRKILVLPFHPVKILHLLVLNIISFFFFGLGYYFIAISLIPLPLDQFFPLIAFFVFSLLVGILSIITPTGLGVREGVITYGLKSLTSVAEAGFVAIASRVILILTEVLFLLIVFGFEKLKKNTKTRIVTFWRLHMHEIILSILIGCYCLYFIPTSFLRYTNFYAGRFDLGNMDQTVWNTTRGRVFEFTNPNSTENISRLAFHADFILVLLAPFYRIWEDPRMLLLIQTLFLAIGAFFVYLIGKQITKDKTVSLLFAVLYLFYPAIQWVNLFDFHPVALAIPLLLATFYFWQRKKYIPFLLFAFLSGITKEQAWVIIAIFGIATFLIQKKRVLGAVIAFVSSAIFYALVFKIIPTFLGSQHFALAYYSDFGDKPSRIIKNILFSPLKTLSTLLQFERLRYIFELLMPTGFFALLGLPLLFFVVPDLAIALLSNNSQTYQIFYQYSSTITPFVFIASLYGFAFLKRRVHRLVLMSLLVGAGIFSSLSFSPLPYSTQRSIAMITKPQPNREFIDTTLSHLPKRFSVAASNNIGAHLSHRQQIYTVPVGIDKADIVALLLNDPGAQPSLKAQKQLAEKLRHDPNYVLLLEKGDFIMFQKKSTLNKASIRAQNHRSRLHIF